eukprot:6189670-Pleurochrysis_carterae.AAC.4
MRADGVAPKQHRRMLVLNPVAKLEGLVLVPIAEQLHSPVDDGGLLQYIANVDHHFRLAVEYRGKLAGGPLYRPGMRQGLRTRRSKAQSSAAGAYTLSAYPSRLYPHPLRACWPVMLHERNIHRTCSAAVYLLATPERTCSTMSL